MTETDEPDERRAFFERSLADLDEEHAAGDLSNADHARLTADYRRRLAELDDESVSAASSSVGARRPGLAAAVAAFVLVVAVGAGILVAQASGRREPGGQISGGGPSAAGATTTTLEVPEALGRCFDLDGGEAFDCYITYTRANPDDARGFLYFGLFSINQGLAGESEELLSGGETFLRRALEIDPDYVEARANLAVVLERTGRDDEAREELTHLEGVDLAPDVQQLVDFVERNLATPPAGGTGP